MKDPLFVSTRGLSPAIGFLEMLLAGPAPDGGLYVPADWPRFTDDEIAGFRQSDFRSVAFSVLRRFTRGAIEDDDLSADIDAAYAGFDDPQIVPMVEIGPGLHLVELFHGPTLAFKDIALQLLGRLMARAVARRGGRATIVAATSGDTGSAAIAAFGGLANIDVFVLHPKDRVSDVQRRQMTTSGFANVHNIAVEGSFDAAQAVVKALFADKTFARMMNLVAVNSINFARIAAQTIYYLAVGARLRFPAVFSVPTGNFGDAFAGEAAARMGLSIDALIVATNANDIVARALNEGVYAPHAAHATLSPSMDIQVASNFERALFEASGRDSNWLREAMEDFARNRRMKIPPRILTALCERYRATSVADEETLETMRDVQRLAGVKIDPHTAVAVAAARRMLSGQRGPVAVLATAHPAKFPEAVYRATGQIPPLPPRLSDLLDRPEKMDVLAPSKALVQAYIAARVPSS